MKVDANDSWRSAGLVKLFIEARFDEMEKARPRRQCTYFLSSLGGNDSVTRLVAGSFVNIDSRSNISPKPRELRALPSTEGQRPTSTIVLVSSTSILLSIYYRTLVDHPNFISTIIAELMQSLSLGTIACRIYAINSCKVVARCANTMSVFLLAY